MELPALVLYIRHDLYFTIEDLAVISYLQKKFHTLPRKLILTDFDRIKLDERAYIKREISTFV